MKYYIVDAFTDELFKGNPAGVCLLNYELPNEIMQKIAFENNLAETAFLLHKDNEYILRWFTPEVEIDLCGHATLAAAFIYMSYVNTSATKIDFKTQSGILTVTKKDGVYTMDFPSRPPKQVDMNPSIEKALGCKVLEMHSSRDVLILVEKESDIKSLCPNIEMIKAINKSIGFGVIVTARGDSCDFVSRFFAPNAGITEDPVTGSTHCTLIPFWSERLGKAKMIARQLSQRGGTLFCENAGDRVKISGTAVCYLKGEINENI